MKKHLKIYFAAAVTGGREYSKFHKIIIKILGSLGHTVLSEHVVFWSLQKEFRKKADASKNPFEFISNHNKKLMQKADIFVAECSQGSLGTGFEIAYGAYELKVPVICLVHENSGRPSSTILGDDNKKIKSYLYNEENLSEILTGVLSKANLTGP